MPLSDALQLAFNRGQAGDELAARADTRIYRNAMRTGRDLRLLVQGGARTRDGTLFIDRKSLKRHLYPFVFARDQEYLVDFDTTEIRIYEVVTTDLAVLVDTIAGGGVTDDQLSELSVAQRGDKMFVCHQAFKPKVLTRTSATTFTYGDLTYTNYNGGVSGSYAAEPMFAFHIPTVGAALGGSGTTLTTGVNHWTADHVGSLVFLIAPNQVGFFTISGYTSATVVTGSITATLSGTMPDQNYSFQESMFSEARGWPGAVGFSKSRLAIGGSTSLPSHYALSEDQVFTAFRTFGTGLNYEVLDTDAIIRPVVGQEVNEILHFVSGYRLLIFTDGGIFYLPETNDSIISPNNVKEETVAPYEVCKKAQPVVYNDAVLFAVTPSTVVREIRFDTLQQSYVAPSNSMTTNVIGRVCRSAAQLGRDDDHETYAYFLNDDGTMAVHLGVEEEDINGWTWFAPARWPTDKYEDVCVVRRKLFVVVAREIDGTTYRFLERFSPEATLDCAVRASDQAGYTGEVTVAPSDTDLGTENVDIVIPGYDLDLAAWRDNAIYWGETANAATINLTTGTFEIYTTDSLVGFGFVPELETMDAFLEGPQFPPYAPMKVAEVLVKLQDSLSLKEVTGRTVLLQDMNRVQTTPIQILGAVREVYVAPPLFTGIQRLFPDADYDRHARVKVQFPYPLRATVLGLARRVFSGD